MIKTNKKIVFILSVVLFLSFFDFQSLFSKKAHSYQSTKTKVTKSTKLSKKKKRKIKIRKAPSINVNDNYFSIISDTLIDSSARFKKYLFGKGKAKILVNVFEMESKNPNLSLIALKSKESAVELEKLTEICKDWDSLKIGKVLCGVNANFWRAYTNAPIGAAISNGEVIEFKKYKEWSSAMIDSANNMYIDRYNIDGYIVNLKTNEKIAIDLVNKRTDSNQIALYNKFYGQNVPYSISEKKITRDTSVLEDAAIMENDSTEIEIDTASVMKEIENEKRQSNLEYSARKIAFEYLTDPAINKNVYCRVINTSKAEIKMPTKGAVLSLGNNDNFYKNIKIGDTIIVKFNTDKNSDIVFTQAVSGTPRLVRNGVANNEAGIEGSKGRRFIKCNLARTAIGRNSENSKIFIVTIPTSSSYNTIGANLEQISRIMKRIGATEALNLDGGGSTSMALNGGNIIAKDPSNGRRIAMCFMAAKINKHKTAK